MSPVDGDGPGLLRPHGCGGGAARSTLQLHQQAAGQVPHEAHPPQGQVRQVWWHSGSSPYVLSPSLALIETHTLKCTCQHAHICMRACVLTNMHTQTRMHIYFFE